jgi:alkylation response protein AidB-like acyl-CoA dehydrogenase
VNLCLSDEQVLLQESFQRFFAAESSTARVRAAEPLGFDRALWNALAATGALTMRVISGEGGTDSSLLDAALLMEMAGKYLASAPIAEAIIAARLLSSIDDNDAAARWLGWLGEGRKIVTLALHETGENPGQLIPAGAIADAVLALEEDGLFLMIASPSGAALPNLGSGAIDRMRPTSADRPVDRILLLEGAAARTRHAAAVEEWKLLTGAALSAIALEALAMAAAYACERRQFGKPIGAFQAISHPLASLVTDAEGARLLTWRAIANVAEGSPLAAAGISMAYWWAADVSGRAVAQSLHTFGGLGFRWNTTSSCTIAARKPWRS